MASKTIRELRTTIAQMDALFPALADKPSKQADLLIEKSSAQKNLSSLEADERETEQDARIKELDAQHEADARRIAELERANAALCARPLPEAIKVPDPEHAAVRQENSRLANLLKSVAESFKTEHERAMMAIRVIQCCSADTAKVFVPLLGFTYAEYARMLMTYKTADQLDHVISAAQCDGPVVVFAKAALALRDCETHQIVSRDSDEQRFTPDNRSAEVKLLEAKESTRKSRIRPSSSSAVTFGDAAFSEAEENLRSQSRSIVGSPDAIPHREQMTPIYVGDLSSTPKEISGGIDFSPWVK
jgi:hypothetical protein